ncbi:hypothetical protein [Rubrivivax gelatinosus]|uniref:hypothetical protein n=1 Tax=Rubrivivax gelatinosus TaxID=28068 RepID=UPI0002E87CDD|nr:hypothetical protein [Rubrivivax gelatinosus]MBG6083106.1 hypothetical protein [Rubrivivax gelatinosus]
MTRALQLYRKYSQEELVRMQEALCADPQSRNTSGGIYLYTAPVRRKLADIAQGITYHLVDRRAAAGQTVVVDGYSGRNSKRRR